MVIFLVSTMLLLLAHAISIAQRDLRDEERRVETAALLDAILAETLSGFERSRAFAGVPEHELGHGSISSETIDPSFDLQHEVKFVVKRLGYEGSWRGVIDTSDPTLPHLIALAPIQLLGGP